MRVLIVPAVALHRDGIADALARSARVGWVGTASETLDMALGVHSPKDGAVAAETSVTTPASAVADTSEPGAEEVHGVVPSKHLSLAPVHPCAGTNARTVIAWTRSIPVGRAA